MPAGVEWTVEHLADADWEPRLDVSGAFGLVCTVCDNVVSEDCERVEFENGDEHVVCCSSCATEISQQYDRLTGDGG